MSQHNSAQHAADATQATEDSHAAPPASAAPAPSANNEEDAGQWQTVPVKSKHAMDRASSLTVPESHSKSARESRRGSQNANAAQAAQIKAAGGRRNSQPNVNGTGQQAASSASTPPTPGSRRLSASGLAAEDFASFRKGHARGTHAKATEWRRGSLDPTDAADAAAAAAAGTGPLSPPPLHPHLPRVPSKGKQMNQQHTPVKDAKRTPKSRGSRSPAVPSPSPQNVGGKDANKDGRSSPLPSVQHSVGHSRFSLGPTDFPNLSFRRVMWAAERKGGKPGAMAAAAAAANEPESSGEASPTERDGTVGASVDLTQRLAESSGSRGQLPAVSAAAAPHAIKPLPVVIPAPPRSFLAAALRSSSSGSSPGGSAASASPSSNYASTPAAVSRPAQPASAAAAAAVASPAAASSFVPIIPIPDDEELTSIAPRSAPSRATTATTAGTEVAASAAPAAPADESPPAVTAAAPASLPAPAAKLKKQKSPRVAVQNESATIAASAAPAVEVAPLVTAAPVAAAPIVSPKSARAAASPKASTASSAPVPAPSRPASLAAPAATAAATAKAPTPKSSGVPKSPAAAARKEVEEETAVTAEAEEEEEEEIAVESPRAGSARTEVQAASILPAAVAEALATMPPAQLCVFALIGLLLLVSALLPPRYRALLLFCVGSLCMLLCAFHRIRVLRSSVPQPWRGRLEEAVGIRTHAATNTKDTHTKDKQKKKSKKR